MSEPAKQMIWVTVDTISGYGLDGPIDDVIERLERIRKEWPGATLDYGQAPYSDHYQFAVQIKRLETDDELNERLSVEAVHERRREERDREEFLRLKAKFEGQP